MTTEVGRSSISTQSVTGQILAVCTKVSSLQYDQWYISQPVTYKTNVHVYYCKHIYDAPNDYKIISKD